MSDEKIEEQEENPLVEGIKKALRTVYDPEIPVNIYDLGLIYKIEVSPLGIATIEMTFTSPNCPMADYVLDEVRVKTLAVEGINDMMLELVFDPPWNQTMMTPEAKLELGMDDVYGM